MAYRANLTARDRVVACVRGTASDFNVKAAAICAERGVKFAPVREVYVDEGTPHVFPCCDVTPPAGVIADSGLITSRLEMWVDFTAMSDRLDYLDSLLQCYQAAGVETFAKREDLDGIDLIEVIGIDPSPPVPVAEGSANNKQTVGVHLRVTVVESL